MPQHEPPKPTQGVIESTRGFVPVPDPTVLTTQNLQREIFSLRELLEARLFGIDKEIESIKTDLRARPAAVDMQIAHLHALMEKSMAIHEEKFRGIDTQFRERDTRTEQTAKDTKVAVDAALQAAEKAVGKQNESFAIATSKSEAATTKQIDQMINNVTTTTGSLNDKIEDVKSRFVTLKDDLTKEIISLRESNSRGLGASNQAAIGKSDSQFGVMALIGVIGVIVAAAIGFAAYVAGGKSGTPVPIYDPQRVSHQATQ